MINKRAIFFVLILFSLSSCSFYENRQFSASKDSQQTIQETRKRHDNAEKLAISQDRRIANERRKAKIKKEQRLLDDGWYVLESCSHLDNKSLPHSVFKNVSCKINCGNDLVTTLNNLANSIGVDIFVDPSIDFSKCNISQFVWNNKQFIYLVDTICNMFELVYKFNNGMLRIESGTKMYLHIYDMPFLNFNRNTENTTVSNGNISCSELDNKLNVSIKNDFWNGFKQCIETIIKQNENSYYAINEQSGIITVFTSAKCHRLINHYIKKVKAIANKQVTIEAKIIEVKLNNEYHKGISWGKIFDNAFGIAFNSVTNTKGVSMFVGNNQSHNNNIENIIKLFEEFGSVRTISNPRITAMNNQPSLLKITKNHIYFTLQYNSSRMSFAQARNASDDENRELLFATSTHHSVPIGMTLFILPSIDDDNDKVTMFIRPTISNTSGEIDDPATKLAIASLKNGITLQEKFFKTNNSVPIIDTREISSVIQTNDGGIIVLGGFIESRAGKNTKSIPMFNKIPIVKEAITGADLSDGVYELVILIRVRIVDE